MQDKLTQIKNFADNAHGSQMRKYSNERYIVHPIRVMQLCEPYTNQIEVLAAALLHDVLEDTPITEVELTEFLQEILTNEQTQKTIQLVVELTDVYTKENYPQWNRNYRKTLETERIKNISADAQTIKYADILDNAHEITRSDPHFAPRFLKECLQILNVASKGNETLYQLAQYKLLKELRKN